MKFWIQTCSVLIPVLLASGCKETFNNTLDADNKTAQPTVPEDFTISIQKDTAIVLKWKADLHFGFRVERKLSPDASPELLALLEPDQHVDGVFFQYTDRDFPVNQEMEYIVSSILPNGNRAEYSEKVTVRLAAPSNITVRPVQNSGFRIRWNPPGGIENGFRLFGRAGNQPFQQLATLASNDTVFVWNRTLSPDSTYAVKMESFSVTRTSPAAEVTYQPVFLSPAAVAVQFVDDTRARITWTDASEIETGFHIQALRGGTWRTLGNTPANAVSADVTTVFSLDSLYQFRVVAQAGSHIAASAAASKQLELAAPATVTVSDAVWSRFTLNWTHATSWNSHYLVEYKKDTDTDYATLTQVAGSTRTASIHLSDTLSKFHLRVRAITQHNRSLPSGVIAVNHVQEGFVQTALKESPTGTIPLYMQSFPLRGELWVNYSYAAGVRRFTNGLKDEAVAANIVNITVSRFVLDEANNRMLAGGYTGEINSAKDAVKAIDISNMSGSDFITPGPAGVNFKISDFRFSQQHAAYIYHYTSEGIKYQITSTGAIWKTMGSGLLDVKMDVDFSRNRVWYVSRRTSTSQAAVVGMYDYYTDQTWTGNASFHKPLYAGLTVSGDSLLVVTEPTTAQGRDGYMNIFNARTGTIIKTHDLPYGFVSGKQIPNSSKMIIVGKVNNQTTIFNFDHVVYLFDFATGQAIWNERFLHPDFISDVEWFGGKLYLAKNNLVEMMPAYKWQVTFL
jgi:hypothetical protein